MRDVHIKVNQWRYLIIRIYCIQTGYELTLRYFTVNKFIYREKMYFSPSMMFIAKIIIRYLIYNLNCLDELTMRYTLDYIIRYLLE